MAAEDSVSAEEKWFIGADTPLRYRVYTTDAHTACPDVSGYAMRYVLRKGKAQDLADDPVLIEKATGGDGITVSGDFDADPEQNQQYVFVQIDAEDTEDLEPGRYQDALMRTDDGSGYVLSYSGKRGVELLYNPAVGSIE